MADLPNDFWSGWIIVITTVSLVVLAWLVLSIYFSPGAKAVEKKDEEQEPVWDDDLREGHSAPPLWWFWFIFAAMIFTVVYLMLYPGMGNFKGALNWSQDSRVESSYANYRDRFDEQRQGIVDSTVGDIQSDPHYMAAAERVFARNCAACHGPDGQGQASLFPDLMDDEWQWGGSPEAIERTIREGRKAEMMSWQGVLSGESVSRVAEYVLALGNDSARGHLGEAIFGQYCAACHGADGRGNQMLGAPDLVNDNWLYGGDLNAVKTSIVRGRKGEMPAFGDRLDDAQVKLLVAWLTRDVMDEPQTAQAD